MPSRLLLLALAACGQMYAKPNDPPASSPPSSPPPPNAAPGSSADPWSDPGAQDPSHASMPSSSMPPSPSPAPAAAGGTRGKHAGNSAAQQLLDAHNRYRAQHCAAPLAWSDEAEQFAKKWAETLRDKGCAFEHSQSNKYGENLAAGTSGSLPPDAVVAMWYDEVKLYDFKKPGFSMQTGHFTQVVWKGTTHVGCAMTQCKGLDVWVCEYAPPGNWQGQYPSNVLPSSCAKP